MAPLKVFRFYPKTHTPQTKLPLRHHALCMKELHHTLCAEELQNLATFQNNFIKYLAPVPICYLILSFVFQRAEYHYLGPLNLVSKHFPHSKNSKLLLAFSISTLNICKNLWVTHVAFEMRVYLWLVFHFLEMVCCYSLAKLILVQNHT